MPANKTQAIRENSRNSRRDFKDLVASIGISQKFSRQVYGDEFLPPLCGIIDKIALR